MNSEFIDSVIYFGWLYTKSGLFVVMLLFLCWAAESNANERPTMELIAVAADGRGFEERDSGHPYIPFGTNYYDPNTGWAPKLWRQFDAAKVG